MSVKVIYSKSRTGHWTVTIRRAGIGGEVLFKATKLQSQLHAKHEVAGWMIKEKLQ